jgi:hypothetical protein
MFGDMVMFYRIELDAKHLHSCMLVLSSTAMLSNIIPRGEIDLILLARKQVLKRQR